MKVLNILTSGETGGIESLCRDIGLFSNSQNGFCFLFGEGKIFEDMTKKGLTTYSLKNYGSQLSLRKLKKLYDISKEYDAIAIHHGDPFLKFYFYILSLIRDKKMISYIHSCYEADYFYPDNKIKKKLAHLIFQKSLNVSDLSIFVSKAGFNTYVKEFKVNLDRSRIIYNGISQKIINNGIKNKIKKDPPYEITYIGRLSHEKGIDLLINAIQNIKKKYSIHVSVVGNGPDRDNLDQLVKKMNLEDIVTFYGQQTNIEPFLKRSTLFVYPSRCQEVFGISLVEAMAYGLPCITNNVGGIPEIITDEKNGFLCKNISGEDLSNRICDVLALMEKNDIESISNNAKKRASDFSILKTIEKIEKEYQNLQ